MVYADTDFFIALIKRDDWLKTNAQKILERYRGRIETGMPTLIEMAFISRRFGLELEKVFVFIFETASVDGMDLQGSLQAASYIQTDKMNVIDAFQAVLSGDAIISSDKAYDGLIDRIKLEK